jgi:hypothetical protein
VEADPHHFQTEKSSPASTKHRRKHGFKVSMLDFDIKRDL